MHPAVLKKARAGGGVESETDDSLSGTCSNCQHLHALLGRLNRWDSTAVHTVQCSRMGEGSVGPEKTFIALIMYVPHVISRAGHIALKSPKIKSSKTKQN